MKIALIQMNASSRKEDNINKAVSFTKQAVRKKAEFILLPEVFHCRSRLGSVKDLRPIAEAVPGPSLLPLMILAKKYKVHILAGSVLEKTKFTPKAYNTSVVINSRGEIVGKYRKRNLFHATIGRTKVCETDFVARGIKPVMVKIKDLHVGMSICYDLRFPEMYQYYKQRGAHVLCVPSAFTKKTGQAHWEVLLRARAIENQCYVLAPNQIGKDGRGVESYGHSMVVDPWGEVLVKGSAKKEEILFATIDKERIKKVKSILPLK